jgi:hypothetical protein
MTTHGIVRLLGRVRGLLRQHEALADVREAIGIVDLIRDEIAIEASAIVRQAGADAVRESETMMAAFAAFHRAEPATGFARTVEGVKNKGT